MGYHRISWSGESCICEQIISNWLEDDQKIAVLAVDPSSPLSGGALLGDRIRISNSDIRKSFFRSLATRGQSGAIPVILVYCRFIISIKF